MPADSVEAIYPIGRFRDYSPISTASSVVPRALAGLDISTPTSAGRPWRASPRRSDAIGSETSVVRSTDELGGSQMMGSSSDDEVGPSGTVRRLAFSPTRTSGAPCTPCGLASLVLTVSPKPVAGAAASVDTFTPSQAICQRIIFSPSKRGSSSGTNSSTLSRVRHSGMAMGRNSSTTPEQRYVNSVRDVMDHDTDDEDINGDALLLERTGTGTPDFKHDFMQMNVIGEGEFGVVLKVRERRTGRLYAIKRSKRELRGKRDRDRYLLEAKALKRLGDHPGVLRFERAWQEDGHFCLQTELCELGTLKDFLERIPSREEIPEVAVWQVLQDVGESLRHVHAMGLVHLDVKPANLLVGDEGGRLKLADFGMATTYGDGVEGVGDDQEGDAQYMAKELLSSTERLPSADMFSLGLTAYEVATRAELPGNGEDWHALRGGRPIELSASWSKDLEALLRQLMHSDPSRRPTADELCKHPRVANVHEKIDSEGSGRGWLGGGRSKSIARRDEFVYDQARAWKEAEAATMDHSNGGLRTPLPARCRPATRSNSIVKQFRTLSIDPEDSPTRRCNGLVTGHDRGPTLHTHQSDLGVHRMLPAVSVGTTWLMVMCIHFLESSMDYTAKHSVISIWEGFLTFKLSMCAALLFMCLIRRGSPFRYNSEWVFMFSGLPVNPMTTAFISRFHNTPSSPPHGLPIHRLTDSLQKLDPWSRLDSSASALGQAVVTDRGDHSPISPASSVASRALGGFDVGTPTSAGRPWRASPRRADAIGNENSVVRSTDELGGSQMMGSSSDDDVGPSGTVRRLSFSPTRTSGAARGSPPHGLPIHRLTDSLQKLDPWSRLGSTASAVGEVAVTDRGDHSPISPASSVASRALGGFDVGTPTNAGRPWRASPRRADAIGNENSVVRSTDELGGSQMMGSSSDDDVGPSGTVRRLSFSPTKTSGAACTPIGLTSLILTVSPKPVAEAVASVDMFTPSGATCQRIIFSHSKGDSSSGTNSSTLSRGRRSGMATGRDMRTTPEQRYVHSV